MLRHLGSKTASNTCLDARLGVILVALSALARCARGHHACDRAPIHGLIRISQAPRECAQLLVLFRRPATCLARFGDTLPLWRFLVVHVHCHLRFKDLDALLAEPKARSFLQNMTSLSRQKSHHKHQISLHTSANFSAHLRGVQRNFTSCPEHHSAYVMLFSQ